jgi:hypothetical protein
MDFGSCKFTDQMEELIDDEGVKTSVTSTYAGIGTRGCVVTAAMPASMHAPGASHVGGIVARARGVLDCGLNAVGCAGHEGSNQPWHD